MSIASNIAGWIVKAGASSIIEAAQGGANIVDQFVENPAERSAREMAESATMRDVLLQQAKNKSLLGAGWVGALGWVMAFAVAIEFVVSPLLICYASWKGWVFHAPELDQAFVLILTLCLLGYPSVSRYIEAELTKQTTKQANSGGGVAKKKPEPKETKDKITAEGSAALTG